MKSPRKAKVLDAGRIPQPEPAEDRPPATATDSNTVMYMGETRGLNPTKYFLTICFDDNGKRVD